HPQGLDPFVWRQAFSARIFSTFGNPNFFGNFLVIVTPITLALMLRRQPERAGGIIFFALLSLVVSILLWQSFRGAPLWMALMHGEEWSVPFFLTLFIAYAFWATI